MKWKIIWSSFAEKQIADIHEYYKEEVSEKVARKIAVGIIKSPNKLLRNQNLGQIELSLKDLNPEYRYILFNI